MVIISSCHYYFYFTPVFMPGTMTQRHGWNSTLYISTVCCPHACVPFIDYVRINQLSLAGDKSLSIHQQAILAPANPYLFLLLFFSPSTFPSHLSFPFLPFPPSLNLPHSWYQRGKNKVIHQCHYPICLWSDCMAGRNRKRLRMCHHRVWWGKLSGATYACAGTV